MKVLSSKQLYEADEVTIAKQNLSSIDLMERASTQIFRWLDNKMQGAQVPIHIFCGIGNNGGDGLALGRLLIENRYKVETYVVNCSDKRSKNFLINYDRIKNVSSSWPKLMTSEADFPQIHPDDIIIDAIFGIGLNRCASGWVKTFIGYLNTSLAFKLSIDIPSGLYANLPIENNEAIIEADYTLTFQTPKMAFFLPQTGSFTKTFETLDIGLDSEYILNTEGLAELIGKAEIFSFYKSRELFTHKGHYGHSVIIGGSYGKIGAAILAAKACLKTGAGLVTAFVPKCGYLPFQTALPEAMVITGDNDQVIENFSFEIKPKALAIGMGLGQAKNTETGFKAFLKTQNEPLLIDADAINLLAKNKTLFKLLPAESILTPHDGELKGLVGIWKDDYDKLEKAKAFSKTYNVILLLKGAYTKTIFHDNIYINTTGNPGMATAGSGDVLSGVICGLLSQGYSPLEATLFGVYLHGKAGDIAVQIIGHQSALLASDILNALGLAYKDLISQDIPEVIDEMTEEEKQKKRGTS